VSPWLLANLTNRNPRAVRRIRSIFSEMQLWLPYCNRQTALPMLWFEVSQVLSKEGRE